MRLTNRNRASGGPNAAHTPGRPTVSGILDQGLSGRPTASQGRKMIGQYMPELLNIYDSLCELCGDDEAGHRFLSLYNPPRMAVACSQAVWPGAGGPLLIRNYDFAPTRWEAVLLRSRWGRQTVVGMQDCLWGLLDGINSSGFAVSLAFGGDPKTGRGFAVPLIVRYLLETCSSVHEAKDALRHVPSFMTYNLSLLDRSAEFTTAFLAPGKKPKFVKDLAATNHQGDIRWPPYARFTRTIERAHFLTQRLDREAHRPSALIEDFLSPPLYASSWNRGFGTLYTALYRPLDSSLELAWPQSRLKNSTQHFKEGSRTLTLGGEDWQPGEVAEPIHPAGLVG